MSRRRHALHEGEQLHERRGAKQPRRFDPAKAAKLDNPARFTYLPVDDVLAMLDVPYGACIIDFGTGTGAYAIAIARARPDARVIALDEQPEMLALLRAKPEAARLANLEVVGSQAVSALRSCANRVLALNVLHELGNAALRRMRDLLAHDGRVLFIDWNADVERPVGPPRDHVYTPEEARARLRRSGYAIRSERLFPYHFAVTAERQ